MATVSISSSISAALMPVESTMTTSARTNPEDAALQSPDFAATLLMSLSDATTATERQSEPATSADPTTNPDVEVKSSGDVAGELPKRIEAAQSTGTEKSLPEKKSTKAPNEVPPENLIPIQQTAMIGNPAISRSALCRGRHYGNSTVRTISTSRTISNNS